MDPVDSNDAILLSAFNFCNPFDDVLPFSTGTVSALDRQHLWGLYTGIQAEVVTLLVTCFLNVKADMQNQMNILSAVAGAANILGTIQDNVNISVTLKTDVNIRGEVC